MPHVDSVQAVARVLTSNRHGELGPRVGQLIRTAPMIGQADNTSYSGARWDWPPADVDREVLRVPIGRSQEPERQLREREGGAILIRLFAVGEHAQATACRWAAVALLIPLGRDAERLTKVLLR